MLLHSWWSPKLKTNEWQGSIVIGISQKWRRARPRTLPGQSLLECVRLPQIKSTLPQQSCLILAARFGIQFPTDHRNDPVLV